MVIRQEIAKKVEDFLVAKFHPAFILIFGSYAKGINHEKNDLDIAFQCKDDFLPALRSYVKLNEVRNPILDRIKEERFVYGE
ncbi:nucleotidyltransferase domain-containing protein [Oceanobacillus oncorhynchi subsp. oncorhynchi]|uniref:nucleotidyltransferase domain-containing protein n=1 Tax=Oceanobacillus TaxID=182709 RepID=UPI0030DBA068